ncbi:MAG: isopenicillin N synthase family oxygenase [Cryobacterium sp.]|nr:isopenicillin N synthase family oxygenase [Cryobacterium sp.]
MPTPLAVPTISIDRDPTVVGREFDETLRDVGFFQIIDHGVPDAVADRCWNVSRNFFDLPLEAKLSVERPEGGLYGYFPMLAESLARSRDDAAPGDLKESFNMGPGVVPGYQPVDETEASLFSPNRWPAAMPELKASWENYYSEMSKLARRLMSMFAHGLELSAEFFDDKIDHSPSALRAINYPEQDASPADGQLRAGAHTDYGTLTILRQEMGRAGLQVRDEKTNSWIDIPPTPGALVINIGDLMARWTNDRWTSTLHRVVNPDAGTAVSTRRQSMPFFHNANYSALVECLPSCLAAGDTPKYEPVLAGPHLAGKSHKAVG